MRPRRWGLTVPLSGIPLSDHETVYREAEAIGYTDFWSAESDVDPWICLALGACWTSSATLGTAIVGVSERAITAPERIPRVGMIRCCIPDGSLFGDNGVPRPGVEPIYQPFDV